jgi:copper chaperone CopZ
MKAFITLLALCAAPLAAHAADTKKITVNGMVCAFCAQGIEKRLTALPQTQAVYVNLGKRIVAVQTKDGQTLDEAQLRHEITEAGYDVVKVEASALTVDAIRAEMKKATNK